MAEGRSFPQRKKNALDEYKLRLSAPPVKGANRRAQLAWVMVSNNPRINVYTNVDGDKDNGRISANMDMPTFYTVIELIRNAVDAEPGTKWGVDNKNHTFYHGKRSEKPELISTTFIGKDDDGCVFISVIAKDRPKIKFLFEPSYYHELRTPEGPLSKSEVSKIYARAYADLLQTLVTAVFNDTYKPPEPRDKQGGGDRGGQGGGQPSQPNQDFEKDIPEWAGADGGGGDDFPM